MFQTKEEILELADYEKVYQKESKQILQQTLSFSGLKIPTQIHYRPVKIYENDHMHEIYTCNQPSNLPHLVLLHGFGGTAMTFVKIFKKLHESFQVHALDSFGVGHSSRGNFSQKFNYDQTRDYFADAIEEWRKKAGIQNFILAGHSFGGYIATIYIEKYPKNVKRLVLLSPVGATEKTDEQIEAQLKQRTDRGGLKGKFFMFFAQKIYNMNIKPSSAMSSCFIGNKMIDRVVTNRLKLDSEEKELWTKYFKDISKSSHSSQTGFYIIFEWPLKPKHTIQSILKRCNLEIPIQFYFGQFDWMDSEGARRLSKECKNVSIRTVSNADHQIIFDNPDEVAYNIIINNQKEKENGKINMG